MAPSLGIGRMTGTSTRSPVTSFFSVAHMSERKPGERLNDGVEGLVGDLSLTIGHAVGVPLDEGRAGPRLVLRALSAHFPFLA